MKDCIILHLDAKYIKGTTPSQSHIFNNEDFSYHKMRVNWQIASSWMVLFILVFNSQITKIYYTKTVVHNLNCQVRCFNPNIQQNEKQATVYCCVEIHNRVKETCCQLLHKNITFEIFFNNLNLFSDSLDTHLSLYISRCLILYMIWRQLHRNWCEIWFVVHVFV